MKISVFVICAEAIMYLSCNLHDVPLIKICFWKTLLLSMPHRYDFIKLWYVRKTSQQIFSSSEMLQKFKFNLAS